MTATGETRISSLTAFCCTSVRADTTSKASRVGTGASLITGGRG